MTRATQYNMALPGPGGQPDPRLQMFASPDGTLGVTGDRVKLVSGRMFGPHEKGQAVIDPGLAARQRLRPGDTLRLVALPKAPGGAASTAKAYSLTVTVAGIAVSDDKVVPATTTAQPRVLLSPPFAATYPAVTQWPLPHDHHRRSGGRHAAGDPPARRRSPWPSSRRSPG